MARDYEMIKYIRNQMKGFDGRFVFDDDWQGADLRGAEHLSLEKYFDNSERHILWQFVCTLLDLSPTKENGDKIRKAIEGIVIEPDC